jgi:hypothetical protein
MAVDRKTQWCPACGAEADPADAFCRACGTPLAGSPNQEADPTEHHEGPSAATNATHRADVDRWKRWFIVSLIVAVLVAVGVIVAVVAGKSHSNAAASQQRRAEVAQHALKARLYGPFQTAMAQRTKFFVAEAAFLDATRDATGKLHRYRSEVQRVEHEDTEINNANSGLEQACRQPLSNVPCPNPTYPSYPTAPNVQDDINGLRTAAADASSLNAQVLAATPQPELKVFYAQLQAAIAALSTDAQYNATALSEAVSAPENGGTGAVEEKKASTLHAETGLPSVRLMNAEAVQVIRELHLELSQYDVPGGTDANPSDHSAAQ